jgi:YcaO-like protein with predicted kinase domain
MRGWRDGRRDLRSGLAVSSNADAVAVKGYRHGTDRLVAPEKTLEVVRPLLAGMGITRLANVTGLDVIGIPVVMACRPNSRSLAVSQGKGLTLDAAKASAAMESIESYHAEHITLPLVLGSYAELCDSHRLVDVADLPTAAGVPFPYHRRLLWVEGHDLVRAEPAWLPFDLVHTDLTVGAKPVAPVFAVTSSGLASGNHLLEAASHAVCELVERDAIALWPSRPDAERAARRLELASVADPDCRDMLDRFAAARVSVAVWDTTSDIGLPCFQCEIAEDPDRALLPMYAAGGYGCHPRREIALLRALSEAAQSRLTSIAGSRDDMYRGGYQRLSHRNTLGAVWASVGAGDGERRMSDVSTFSHGSFEADLALEIERLQAVGIREVVVVELTKAEIGLPVVRVVVPGLESLYHGHSGRPGRRARALQAAAP